MVHHKQIFLLIHCHFPCCLSPAGRWLAYLVWWHPLYSQDQLPHPLLRVRNTIPVNWWIISPRLATPFRLWQPDFNTTIQEIRDANPIIPADATTMPPGMPMKIPIYYLPFWGTTYKIIPDSLFVNGPASNGFDTGAFVSSHPGWLKDYRAYAEGVSHSGAEIVDMVATNYSISPRVLLALLEFQTGALSQPVAPSGSYPLGEVDYTHIGLYMQLIWAADVLNSGYYGWRTGSLTEIEHLGGSIERPDPWQTAASVAFQYYFSRHDNLADYTRAIGPEGVAHSYQTLFGDPWKEDPASIPVSLQQPALTSAVCGGRNLVFHRWPAYGLGESSALGQHSILPLRM